MRWFKRSVVLCALALVLTPARADAWFEWLDWLSGPGPWYGYKADLRVWCSGPRGDWKGMRGLLDQAIADSLSTKPDIRLSAAAKWEQVFANLKKSNLALPLTDPLKFASEIEGVRTALGLNQAGTQFNQELAPLAVVKIGEDLHRVLDVFERGAASIASTGIFLSLCKNDRTRALAVEIGFSSLQAWSNPAYAGDHSIRLNTISAGLSYRVPLPPTIDIIDVGANVGMYHFSSRGFKSFSGLMVEPVFIDFHGPTKLVQAAGLKKLGALLTVRLSLVMFPAGFDGAQFASVASKPAKISGREATPSVTVFFNLTPLLWHRPKSTVPQLAAGMQ
jgi:hypothetical protein